MRNERVEFSKQRVGFIERNDRRAKTLKALIDSLLKELYVPQILILRPFCPQQLIHCLCKVALFAIWVCLLTHLFSQEALPLLAVSDLRLERRFVTAPLSLSQQRYGAAISLRGFLRAARPRVLLRLLGQHKCLVDHILFELLREQGARHR